MFGPPFPTPLSKRKTKQEKKKRAGANRRYYYYTPPPPRFPPPPPPRPAPPGGAKKRHNEAPRGATAPWGHRPSDCAKPGWPPAQAASVTTLGLRSMDFKQGHGARGAPAARRIWRPGQQKRMYCCGTYLGTAGADRLAVSRKITQRAPANMIARGSGATTHRGAAPWPPQDGGAGGGGGQKTTQNAWV